MKYGSLRSGEPKKQKFFPSHNFNDCAVLKLQSVTERNPHKSRRSCQYDHQTRSRKHDALNEPQFGKTYQRKEKLFKARISGRFSIRVAGSYQVYPLVYAY